MQTAVKCKCNRLLLLYFNILFYKIKCIRLGTFRKFDERRNAVGISTLQIGTYHCAPNYTIFVPVSCIIHFKFIFHFLIMFYLDESTHFKLLFNVNIHSTTGLYPSFYFRMNFTSLPNNL